VQTVNISATRQNYAASSTLLAELEASFISLRTSKNAVPLADVEVLAQLLHVFGAGPGVVVRQCQDRVLTGIGLGSANKENE
jgi:hypothetical protein